MGRNKVKQSSSIDFDFGISQIIPATQEAYKVSFDSKIRKDEGTKLKTFKQTLTNNLDSQLKNNKQFPTSNEVFIFILQYFAAGKEYSGRDIDNIAKTILDVLKGRFYDDDSQVKTLLVGKKIEKRIPQNFAYVSIKEIRGHRDVDALKISGLERSVGLYYELKKSGLL